MDDVFDREERELLTCCTLCPRECGVNRFKGADGYCGCDAGFNIASICIHKGEEPAISGPSGICNIFFSGCNLSCIYCQNYDISRPCTGYKTNFTDLNLILERVEEILALGIKTVGFVSPSHMVPQMKAIIRGLHEHGLKPVTVYNTNSYDRPETLKEIQDIINVYLPDLKYSTYAIAAEFSDAPDYPEVAIRALKEMYYQKGSSLRLNDQGVAESGILIRHLVLPGHVEESLKVLRLIANEISTGINISLMSQYHPVNNVKDHPALNRSLYREEYNQVVDEMEKLGFRNGWLQDAVSHENYLPDFGREHPFEN